MMSGCLAQARQTVSFLDRLPEAIIESVMDAALVPVLGVPERHRGTSPLDRIRRPSMNSERMVDLMASRKSSGSTSRL